METADLLWSYTKRIKFESKIAAALSQSYAAVPPAQTAVSAAAVQQPKRPPANSDRVHADVLLGDMGFSL